MLVIFLLRTHFVGEGDQFHLASSNGFRIRVNRRRSVARFVGVLCWGACITITTDRQRDGIGPPQGVDGHLHSIASCPPVNLFTVGLNLHLNV
jgi:hypothetical protein